MQQHIHRCDTCNGPFTSEIKKPVYKTCDYCLNMGRSVMTPKKAESFDSLVKERYKHYLPALSRKNASGTYQPPYEEGYQGLCNLLKMGDRKTMLTKTPALVVLSRTCAAHGITFAEACAEFAKQALQSRSAMDVLVQLENEQYSHMKDAEEKATDAAEYFAMTHEGHDFKETVVSYLESGTVDDPSEEENADRFAQIG